MAAVRMGVRGRRARGLITTQSLDGGAVLEQETQACRHCQAQLVVGTSNAERARVLGGKRIGGYCAHCNSVLCEDCERRRLGAASSREACRPYAEQIEESLRKQALRRACGL